MSTAIGKDGDGGNQVPLVLGSAQANAAILSDGTCPTLTAQMGTGGNNMPLVLTQNQVGEIRCSETVAPTLTGQANASARNHPLVLDPYNFKEDDKCFTLRAGISQPTNTPMTVQTVASGGVLPHVFKLRSGCNGGGKGYLGQDDKSFTLATGNDQYMMNEQRVRKLTPIECERLQGFPDNYTRIPWKGKGAEECPDSPRYKAIGNSWAVPCVRWIGKRIQDELEKNK